MYDRMQAAFAEITVEDVANGMDEDDEFVNDKGALSFVFQTYIN